MGNVVKKFITMGVDINPPSVSVYNASTDKSDMYTPLSISIVNGHMDIVTMLIDHAQSHSISLMNHRYKMQLDNTGDNIYTTGITCLMLACRYGRYDVLSYLLEAVYSSDLASLIEALDSNNQTLFHHLSNYTSSNSSNKSILRDIFVNVINQYRTSNQSTTFANITALLEVRDSLCGDTCLHIACEKKNIEMVFCLTELSAISVNTVNNLNITPLFIAIKKRHEKIIRQLLSHGANPNIICGGVIVDESVVDKKNTSQGALMPISCYDEALKLPKTTAVYKLFVEFKQKQIEDANKISTECIENKTSIISLKEDDVREGSANVSEMSPTTHDNISNKWNAGNTNKDKIVPFTPIVSNSYNTSSNSYVDLTLSSVGIDQSSNNKGWSNNQPPLHVHKTISMQGGVLGNTLPGLKMGETTNRVLFDDNDTLELLEITGMTPRMDQ
jgi:ankyrin repeat protein